jgi:ribonuclease PH
MENINAIFIDFRKTDKQTNSVRIMAIFLILVFAIVPLAEIVTGLDYNAISHYSKISCIVGLESFEPLSFKAIK